MSLLFRSQLRFVAHAPWSAATALLGVALGVASVVAVHLISARVVASLDQGTPPHLAGLTHVLDRPDLGADDYFELRERWRRHPRSPVQALVPVVEGRTSVEGGRVRVVGADWLAMPAPTGEATAGDPLTVSAGVLVGEAVLAHRSLGFEAGEDITVAGRRFRIAGVLDGVADDTLVADISAAQVMLGQSSETVARIGLALRDPWQPWRRWLDRLMPGFAAGLPRADAGDLAVLAPQLAAGAGWRVTTVSSQRPSAEFARSVLFNLGALGTLALLVAWFLIYQVGVIWLRRQRLLLERLHAVGVSHGALGRSFVALFVAVGTVATIIGVVVGVLLAALLTGLATEGLETAPEPAGFAALDTWVGIKAVGSGIGVCLLGAVGAFAGEWRGYRLPSLWRWLLAPLLVVVIAVGILVERSGVLGGFLAILALSLTGVALVPPLLTLLRRGVLRFRGSMLMRLALRDVAWHPHMLGVALAALSLAVATGIGIALMVESFRGDFERMLAVRLAGDLYLYPDDDVAAVSDWLAQQPEVTGWSRFGRDQVRVAGLPVELGYARFDAAESGRYGFPRALEGGEALVNERLARDLNLTPGAGMDVANGRLTMVGTFPGFGDPMGRLLVDVSSLERLDVEPRYDRITVTLAPDTAPAFLDRLGARFPDLEAESRTAVRELALRIFDRTFAITRALTLVAIVVAVVATYNALTALKLHQASTTALLRTQGATARQVHGIALIRAGIVGGIAMTLALPLGMAMAWTLCAVINPRSFGWTVALSLPPSAWLPPLLLGLLAAVLAGAMPAPRERGALHEGV